MNPPLEPTPLLCSSLSNAWLLCWCAFFDGGDGCRGGVFAACCLVVALSKAPCTVYKMSTSTHSDHAFRMATNMVALIAGLYVGESFHWVLEPTFTAHLAVPSPPVPADCHFCCSVARGCQAMQQGGSWSFGASVWLCAQVKASKVVHRCRQVTANP